MYGVQCLLHDAPLNDYTNLRLTSSVMAIETRVLTAVLPLSTIISMKTAISLPDDMFKEIEEVTKECDRSRSQVFAMAVREFLERRKSRKLLEALNDAYQETETPEETGARRQAKAYHARRVREEPY